MIEKQNTEKDVKVMSDRYLRLMETNAGSHLLKRDGKWLILGSCVITEHPQIIKEITNKYDTILHVCPEAFHMNMIETKLAAMVKIKNPKEVSVVTVDGSPHCIQLHYIIEDLVKYFQEKFEAQHFVISSKMLYQINNKSVKASRHLLKIERFLQNHERKAFQD